MAATYEPIATSTLGSAASSITFSSIPATYTDLRLVLVSIPVSAFTVRLRVNSNTGTNYSRTLLYGDGSAAESARTTSATGITLGVTHTEPTLYTLDFFSYAGSTNKTVLFDRSADRNGAGGVDKGVGLWRSTSAITSITLDDDGGGSNFASGTTATLYGILKA